MAPHADSRTLDEHWQGDRAKLRGHLSAWVERPEIREALFLASPDLDAAIQSWLDDPGGAKNARVERTLVRYFSRMCGRSTPFGLFAGCSTGKPGDTTRLPVASLASSQRHTRLDMDYLCALSEGLLALPQIRAGVLFRPNSSLCRVAGQLRYSEARQKDRDRSYHLVAVEEMDYLLQTLANAEGGATLDALAGSLVDDSISLEEAHAYVQELVSSQILVPDLAPAVTGPEPIHDLIAQLNGMPETRSVAVVLEKARQAMEGIDGAPLGVAPDVYRAIAKSLESLPVKADLARLFQVDMVRPSPGAMLGPLVAEELKKGIELLHRLQPRPLKDPMGDFKEAFQARYDQREVPLVEALDEESGIGFGASSDASPLLDTLAFPNRGVDGGAPWGQREAFLLDKLLQCRASGDQILRLEEADVEVISSPDLKPLPGSFAVLARIAARSPEAVDRGEFKLAIDGASGPSGGNLLGRFCHGDAALTEHLRKHLAEEASQRPGAVHAEIVHLPEGRIGNVILRPLLRDYEIPFLGRSGAPSERQILATDLLVSIRDGRVVLRSKRLGMEVLPRLTNAHNYNGRSLGIYRFLCSLQHQGVAGGLAWTWGALESSSFVPRVEAGRLVLSKARWRVRKAELSAALGVTGAAAFSAIQDWRSERLLPRLVLLSDGDNKLIVDLDNALSVETFIELVRKREGFVLEELYPGAEDLCAEGPEGRFVHELVVPFSQVADGRAAAGVQPQQAAHEARTFEPGSEWLYLKVYAGPAALDRLLRETVRPVVQAAMAEGDADGWFFIRYSDPDCHLRLRFHGDPARLSAKLLPTLHEAFRPRVDDGSVWRIQVDTYEREIERYGGGASIGLAERLFQEDSQAVLELFAAYPGEAALDTRWRLCLRGMDLLLDGMGFELEEKLEVARLARASFLKEFKGGGPLERQLGDRFRKDRAGLEASFGIRKPADEFLDPGLAILANRSVRLRPVMDGIRQQASRGGPTLRFLAPSFLHMHANRLLRASARAQETVLYDFLVRIYESQTARSKKRAKNEMLLQEP